MNPSTRADKDFPKTVDDFKELRDQIYLLEKDDGTVESPAVRWFENMKHDFSQRTFVKYTDDFTTLGYIDITDKDVAKTPSANYTVTEALHAPLLKQNWSEVLGMLKQVTTTKDLKEILPTLGCEVICQEEDPLTRCALMRDFVNQLRHHEQLDVPQEFAVKYILFCICNRDAEDAKMEMQVFEKDILQQKKRNFYIEGLFHAYQGLFMYLEWKELKEHAEALDKQEDAEASFEMMSQDWTSKVQVTDMALKAINSFKGIEKIEGTWDIFVQKYVELLVYSDRVLEAFKVLVSYSEHHMNSLNAQKYLYQFCVEHFPSRKDIIIEQLEVIAELNTSDSLALEYCKEVGEACKNIPCLFNLLDYPVWQSDVEPWKILADYLERIFVSREEHGDAAVKSVKECWSIRESWWPAFHFNNYILTKDTNDLDLLRQKYVINVILIGHGNSFARLVGQKLKEGGYYAKLKHVFDYHGPAS